MRFLLTRAVTTRSNCRLTRRDCKQGEESI